LKNINNLALLVTTSCLVNIPKVQAGTVSAMITVKDIKGAYTIPYIQSDRELLINVDFSDPLTTSANLTLTGKDFQKNKKVAKTNPHTVFTKLPTGEYTLLVEWLKADGTKLSETVLRRIGVGTVLAAIGDSLTEGYHGHGFKKDIKNLKAANFPAKAVSKDGRNFPQYSPTTYHHKPTVNCFQSWLTELNDELSGKWEMPVFIANEGWGGFTSASYLNTMRHNGGGWVDRMRLLKPDVWLIHLGVNDERHKVSAASFAKNIRAIVNILLKDYKATPSNIYIAYPSYDYAAGAEPVLQSYIAEIDKIIAGLKLRKGPDFFKAFSKNRAKWYGNDPVHPGIEGMNLMAKLWTEKLAPNVPIPKKNSRFIQNLDNGKKQVIVTYGTSLTAGGAWVLGLQKALSIKYPGLAKVVNSGKGAMCSIWGVNNLQKRVIDKKPDTVIMEFSVNDAYLPYKMTPADCQKNLNILIKQILKDNPNCEIILMVMNPMVEVHAAKRPKLETFNNVYRTTARKKGLLLIDHYPSWLSILNADRKEFDRIVPDGAHPDTKGCKKVVTPNILKAIGL
jgi:acyl-CoA thioesterase I